MLPHIHTEDRQAFGAELLGLQGSGWGWLVSKGGAKGRLEIVTTKDQRETMASRRAGAPAMSFAGVPGGVRFFQNREWLICSVFRAVAGDGW
jgi:superoxide dismutase